MSVSARMMLVLTVVGVFSGLSLVYMDKYAEPYIDLHKQEAVREAIGRVLPGVDKVEEVHRDETVIYRALDSSGKLLGYAFLAEGPGYQGKIQLMVGVAPDLRRLTGMEVLESVETPGLGAKITESSFEEQFRGLEAVPAVGYVKAGRKPAPNEITAITGATISSASVVRIVNEGLNEVRRVVRAGPPDCETEATIKWKGGKK